MLALRPELRMLRPRPATGLARRNDVLVRVHFCKACAEGVLKGRCPNCGGELVRRPIRPADKLAKFPASTERKVKARRLRARA